jgi:hypothetical protein
MTTNAKAMGCGGCGCEEFRLYQDNHGLAAECVKCKSVSTIRPRAELKIDWIKESSGCLAVRPGQ